MRKHRTFEKISSKKLTIQVPCLTPRQLMNLLVDDVEIDIKSRAGYFGNGSQDFPIPRSMSIARMAQMTPKKNSFESAPTPAPMPVPTPAHTPVPTPE